MDRRTFLRQISAAGTAVALSACELYPASSSARSMIMTVNGPVPIQDMGLTLCHEHALANFQPYQEWLAQPRTYDLEEVVSVVLPHLHRLRQLDCRTFVDATAAHLGRDPRLLRVLSERSGLHITTVTGAYAAADYQFLPQYVRDESVQSVAERWIKEAVEGIDGTNVRPAFIKLGFNGGPLSSVEDTLIRAAALAHRQTGLTIGAHTGPAVAAFAQLSILEKMGVDPSAWIWIHAQNEPDLTKLLEGARRGAWIELDGFRAPDTDAYVERVRRFADAGVLEQLLLSQDNGWYSVGRGGGDNFRAYDTILTTLIPALRSSGFSAGDVDTLFVTNPARAFSIGVR